MNIPHRGLSIALILLALFGSAAVSGGPSDQITSAATIAATPAPVLSDTPLVFTYFFYWYDSTTGAHLEPDTLKHHLLASPFPSWTNVEWYKKELDDMKKAGIDVALMVYWGSESEEDSWSYLGLQNLVAAWRSLKAEGKDPPRIGMFLDTTIVRGRDLRTTSGKGWFYRQFSEFYRSIPRDMWGVVNGRPVSFLFTSNFTGAFDQTTFDHVYASFTRDFGVLPYIVREVSWDYPVTGWQGSERIWDYTRAVRTENSYIWAAAQKGFVDRGGVATVGPGYDDRHLQDRQGGSLVDRRGGAFYVEEFRKAIAAKKPLLAVETWNEIHEGSGISETVEFGRKYIDLTAGLTADYKRALGPAGTKDITTAPTPFTPSDGAGIPDLNLSLSWSPIAYAAQYELQVAPAQNDGPGIDVILFAMTSFSLPAPNRNQGPFVMLPGMAYSWRVRASAALGAIGPNDSSWGPWSTWSRFATPAPSSGTITAVSPPSGAWLPQGGQAIVQWGDAAGQIFFYEVQMSTDSDFGSKGPRAAVWHNLIHGGVSDPINSWRSPALQANQMYYWRVRPRVQGEGAPVPWSSTYWFQTAAGLRNRIAFSSDVAGGLDIYSMAPDGSGLIRLTDEAAFETAPVWSPDTSGLAFVSSRGGNSDIYVLKDGSAPQRLTTNTAVDTAPAWSPDGKKLAFASSRDGNMEIYVMNADGTGQNRLTTAAYEDTSPTWSADGKAIVFSSQRSGDLEIFTMNSDGSGQRNLTNRRGADITPAFSPDGRYIAFASFRDGSWEIYRMTADGGDVQRLTRDHGRNLMPTWSPDGKKLVFVSDRDNNWELYLMDLATGEQQRLTNNRGVDASPSWSR